MTCTTPTKPRRRRTVTRIRVISKPWLLFYRGLHPWLSARQAVSAGGGSGGVRRPPAAVVLLFAVCNAAFAARTPCAQAAHPPRAPRTPSRRPVPNSQPPATIHYPLAAPGHAHRPRSWTPPSTPSSASSTKARGPPAARPTACSGWRTPASPGSPSSSAPQPARPNLQSYRRARPQEVERIRSGGSEPGGPQPPPPNMRRAG